MEGINEGMRGREGAGEGMWPYASASYCRHVPLQRVFWSVIVTLVSGSDGGHGSSRSGGITGGISLSNRSS